MKRHAEHGAFSSTTDAVDDDQPSLFSVPSGLSRRLACILASLCVAATLVGSAAVSAQDDDEGGFSFGEDALAEPEDEAAEEPEAGEPEAAPVDDVAPDSATAGTDAPSPPPEDETPTEEEVSADLDQADRIKAVSRKTFLKRHRFYLSPNAGTTINDSFYRQYMVGGSLGFHLVENLSIEVSGAYNVFTERLPPVNFLRKNARAIPAEVLLFGHAEVGAAFTPVYGKFAVFREWIIHFDAYVAGGVGVVIESGQEIPLYPAANLGVGGRVFVLPWLVVKADVRDYAYAQQIGKISTLQNLVVFSVGVSVYFPFDFDYENEAFKVVDAG